MKSEIETQNQLRAEELRSNIDLIGELEVEIMNLQASIDLIDIQLVAENKQVIKHTDDKRFVFWL